MFVTLPQLSIPYPTALGVRGAQYWRAFHLTFPHPWFIANFKTYAGEDELHEAWCMSSDIELVDRVEHVTDERLIGLLCVVPPWSSCTGRWSCREVSSIWRARDPELGAHALLFRDLAGADFVAGLRVEVAENFVDRKLVVEIPPSGIYSPSATDAQ